MTVPFIFITTYPIADGKLDGLRQFLRELFAVLEVNAPRALAINAYVKGDGTEVTIVQVHQDAASIQVYWKVLHQNTGRQLAQFVDAPTSTQVFGDPGDLVLARTRHSTDTGAAVNIKPEHVGGFTRLTAAAR